MQLLNLTGQWQLHQADNGMQIAGSVPGCVHLDLLNAGKIPDPFYRDQEYDVMWVAEKDWIYRRTFHLDASFEIYEQVLLVCNGLDTIAIINLNGERVGYTDNMFHPWEFDIKSLLKSGENQIEIHFESPLRYLHEKEERSGKLYAWDVGVNKLNSGGWIRKEPCSFGWDWGPRLPSSGIWRDISIQAFQEARLKDVRVGQNHTSQGHVILDVSSEVERFGSNDLTCKVRIERAGQIIAETSTEIANPVETVHLSIEAPELWWPNGLGKQPLYDVFVEIIGADGTIYDSSQKRIGLRTIQLERKADEWGESFHFVVNGVSFFAKGANWIPADSFVNRLTEDDYRRLIEDSTQANMNMLRVWGGGIYEQDIFYDLCDEYGICVWQDFMFACSTYPAFDAAFLHSVAREAVYTIKHLRHHASMALWCGNNEIEQGLVGLQRTETTMSLKDYSRLFDDLLPKLVELHDGQCAYWNSSPHTPIGDRANFNDPTSGDAHLWDVWHGRKPFEWYRTTEHRFVSEFGFQSFPEPRIVESFTKPEDRNITSYIMEHHQRSPIGNSTIIHYMLDWFRMPKSFDDTLWLSQILQGMAMKYAIEHWRRNMPRSMGALYWQLNDCWPVASWSSIDYYGNWKALHHMARHFFAPLLISGIENGLNKTVEIYVTSDLHETTSGTMQWKVVTTQGTILDQGSQDISIQPHTSALIDTVSLAKVLEKHTMRDVMIVLTLVVDGVVVSSNFVTLIKPKHLELANPNFNLDVTRLEDGQVELSLSAEHPAIWVWLTSSDAMRFSDNFFHLFAGDTKKLEVKVAGDITLDQITKSLHIQSLWDTYQ